MQGRDKTKMFNNVTIIPESYWHVVMMVKLIPALPSYGHLASLALPL